MKNTCFRFHFTHTVLVVITFFSLSSFASANSCQHLFNKIDSKIVLAAEIKIQIHQAIAAGQNHNLYLGESNSVHPTYRDILQYFSIDNLALLHRGLRKLSEIPSFEYVKKASVELAARRAQINLSKIDDIDDFLVAASRLLNEEVRFRNFDVVMSKNVTSEKPQIMTIDRATFNKLRKNPLLQTFNTSGHQSHIDTGISYLNITGIQKILQDKPVDLDGKLVDIIFKMDDTAGSYKLKIEKTAYQAALRAILSELFSDNSSSTPFELYQRFMAIHPFRDGNGRSGRLFYDWVRYKKQGQQFKVGLPLFDMDLLSARADSEQLSAGAAIHHWVSSAKSDEEFLLRADIALDALLEVFPELKKTFPELRR